MVEQLSPEGAATPEDQKRTFPLEYSYVTFFQGDKSTSTVSTLIKASSEEEAALRAIREMHGMEQGSEVTHLDPQSLRLDVGQEGQEEWVHPFEVVPDWHEVIDFRMQGHRMSLEPGSIFEAKLKEYLESRNPQ